MTNRTNERRNRAKARRREAKSEAVDPPAPDRPRRTDDEEEALRREIETVVQREMLDPPATARSQRRRP